MSVYTVWITGSNVTEGVQREAVLPPGELDHGTGLRLRLG